MIRTPGLVVLIAITLMAGHDARAAEDGPLQDRFAISLGGFDMSSDTTIRADSIDGVQVGDTVEVEPILGIDDESVFRAELTWRFLPRHKLHLMYFETDRTGTRTLEEDLNFGDETFPVDVEVDSDLAFDITELAYEYQLLTGDDYQLGASIGIHNVGFDMALEAEVDAGGGGAVATLRESVSTDAPLPVLGLRGIWHIGGDFYLQGRAQYFALEVGDYDGRITDFELGVVWQFSRHFGVGAAYNRFDTRVDSEDEGGFQGRLEWEYEGAQLFVRAGF